MERLKPETRRALQRCPLCREDIPDLHAEGLRSCAGCVTLYHETCLVEMGGCSTLGCTDRRPTAVDEQVNVRRVRGGPRVAQRALNRRVVTSFGLGVLCLLLLALWVWAIVAERVPSGDPGYYVGIGLALAMGWGFKTSFEELPLRWQDRLEALGQQLGAMLIATIVLVVVGLVIYLS